MKYRLLISKIFEPIIKELPIILVFFILIKPTIIEFFVDNDYDGIWDYLSVFSVCFLYAFFIAATICFSKKSWLRWTWYVLLYFIFAISSFIIVNFEMNISPTLITLLTETNEREAGEFMQTYLLSATSIKVYIKLLIYIILTFILEICYRRYITPESSKWHSFNFYSSLVVICLLCIGIMRWSQFSDYFRFNKPADAEDSLEYPSDDIYTRLICSLCIQSKQSGVIKRAVDISLNVSEVHTTRKDTDSLNIIFVIGESFIKSHASIYGYPLPTTPNFEHQKEKGNLYSYNDVISPFNYTSMSVKNMMSCNGIDYSEKWYDYPYFPVLFRKAGYQIYFWSNQHESTYGALSEYVLNSYLFNRELSTFTYTKTNKEAFEYDEQLVDDFKRAFDNNQSNNLIIFHIQGQHTAYIARFPNTKDHVRFTIHDIHRKEAFIDDWRKQQIANYDNAVLYTDYVLSQIFDFFSEKNAIVVFLSDHGEEVFDYRDRMGRSYKDDVDSLFIKYQYEIPFFIWCSDLFIKKYPKKVEAIRESVNKPFMIDNVCQILFHIGDIQTKYYHSKRDILSPDYSPKERTIRGGEINYDKLKK